MYQFRQFVGFVLVTAGFSLFLYATYDLWWRLFTIFFGLFLINQGMRFRGLEPIQVAFNTWTNRSRF